MEHPYEPQPPPGQQPRPGFAPYRFPQSAPPPSRSGATGIIAAVLAGVGAVACLGGSLFGILGVVGINTLDTDPMIQTSVGIAGGVRPVLILGIVLTFVAGLLLTAGTVTLAQRKMAGRWFVVGGCAVTIAGNLLSLGYAASAMGAYGSSGAVALLAFIFPIATLVLVVMPSTTAWIAAKRKPSSFY
ncbi:MAG: hypothetical protein WBB00_04070 [Mycobacterium sp.]